MIEAVFFPVPDPASHAGELLRWLGENIAGRA
jgi:hypothetical protein